MKKLPTPLFVAIALLSGCNRSAPASGASEGRKTYQYLREVGLVRMLLNSDDQERIPPAIVRRQIGDLRKKIVRTDVYKQVLTGISTDGVDPSAIRFTKDLEDELDAFKYDGLDTAILLEKLREAEAKHLGPSLLPPIARGVVAVEGDNVLAAVSALLQFINNVDQRHAAEMQYVAPYVAKVTDDQARLKTAKTIIKDDAVAARNEFTSKYPEQDWTVPEVLPQPVDERQ
jgi:hypothetical protein